MVKSLSYAVGKNKEVLIATICLLINSLMIYLFLKFGWIESFMIWALNPPKEPSLIEVLNDPRFVTEWTLIHLAQVFSVFALLLSSVSTMYFLVYDIYLVVKDIKEYSVIDL